MRVRTNDPLTVERLREVLDYDPETGVFTWKVFMSSRAMAGSVAGRTVKSGYVRIAIDGLGYLAQRLAWFSVTGAWPADQIDHRDCNRANNRFANLRPSTHQQNQFNRTTPMTNTSGYKGVSWNKKACKWVAMIKFNGRAKNLGRYDDIGAAAAAYERAAKERFGEFARFG